MPEADTSSVKDGETAGPLTETVDYHLELGLRRHTRRTLRRRPNLRIRETRAHSPRRPIKANSPLRSKLISPRQSKQITNLAKLNPVISGQDEGVEELTRRGGCTGSGARSHIVRVARLE